jgi:hypothetical protein
VSAATLFPPSASPLSAEHHHELALAHDRARKIRKAARVASMNGWFTAIVAACSVPFAFYDVTGFVMMVGMSIVAYNEFRGRKRLLAFDPSGATLLGNNQIGLMALISGYCLWMMYGGLTTTNPIAQVTSTPELQQVLGSVGNIDDLYQGLVVIFYATVIVLTVVFQGINAIYYYTRRRHVEEYVRETPAWVIDLQRVKGM